MLLVSVLLKFELLNAIFFRYAKITSYSYSDYWKAIANIFAILYRLISSNTFTAFSRVFSKIYRWYAPGKLKVYIGIS